MSHENKNHFRSDSHKWLIEMIENWQTESLREDLIKECLLRLMVDLKQRDDEATY